MKWNSSKVDNIRKGKQKISFTTHYWLENEWWQNVMCRTKPGKKVDDTYFQFRMTSVSFLLL